MTNLEDLSREREQAHQKLLSLGSQVYRSFLEMERAAFTDGALPRKAKELIALGIAVQMNCEFCMQWHLDQAARAGATAREIVEAIEVAIEMGAGRVTVAARFALKALEKTRDGASIAPTSPEVKAPETHATEAAAETPPAIAPSARPTKIHLAPKQERKRPF